MKLTYMLCDHCEQVIPGDQPYIKLSISAGVDGYTHTSDFCSRCCAARWAEDYIHDQHPNMPLEKIDSFTISKGGD